MTDAIQSRTQNQTQSAQTGTGIADKLEILLSPVVEGLGYEIVLLEVLNYRQKIVRLLIDHLTGHTAIGVEDCAKVSRGIDGPLEAIEQDASVEQGVRAFLTAGFELEVSSPGIDRPLTREKDFLKFQGREIRLSLYRAMSEAEVKNASYFSRNPKQKNYFGELTDFKEGEILLKVSPTMGSLKAEKAEKKPGGKKTNLKTPEKSSEKVDLVHIPLSLVSKANLEPDYDIADEDSDEEESAVLKSKDRFKKENP